MRSQLNHRPLSPSEQLKVLTTIWGNSRDGYVFLPWISGSSKDSVQRRKNYHEGRAYAWPSEKKAILEHLQQHAGDDIYFCPNIFNGKRRNEELADAERTLWADLDQVDPNKLGDLKPTIAWQSSPGRYQGVWLLDRLRMGASWPGKENQRLTYSIGADPSGWDATQLLRVPGRPNHKPHYKEDNGGDPVEGKLLWHNGPRYVWEDFDDLPEIGLVEGSDDLDLLDEDFLQGIDRHKLWSRVRLKISPRVRRYMGIKREEEIEGADRSDVLWDIERELADVGCTLAEIVAIVRPSVWNKYVGRNDELRRLKTEASKAIAVSKENEGGGALEVIEDPKPKVLKNISELFTEIVPRPRWLIKDIWPEGACGFIAGAPKSYKSWLAFDLAVSLTTRTKFLGEFPVMGGPHQVLYIQEEDAQSLIKDRFEYIIDGKSSAHHPLGSLSIVDGQRKDRGDATIEWAPPVGMPLFMHVRTGVVLSDPSWQSWLDEMLAEVKIKVVVIDTLFTSVGGVDTDKATDLMTKVLRPLRDLAEKYNCAIILVHHNKKATMDNGAKVNKDGEMEGPPASARGGANMMGSQTLYAWSDASVFVHATREKDVLPGVVDEEHQENIPGVEVYVEREAKTLEGLRFKAGVPRMTREAGKVGLNDWSPIVHMGWFAGGGTPEHQLPDDVKSIRNGTYEGAGGTRKRGSTLIVSRMKEMGITDKRGKTLPEIAEILDVQSRTVSRQLGKALEVAAVFKDEATGKWFVTGEEESSDS